MTLALLGLLPLSGAVAHAEDRFAGLPDPTRPSYAAGGVEEGPGVVHGLRLQSILIGPQRHSAVINGQRLAVGERIGAATVVAIHRDSVVMRRAGGEFTLKLVPRYVSRAAKTGPQSENNSHAGSP
jgi:hypothetical protein